MKKKSIWSHLGGFLMGKGFYMVLLLCVLAIGGSGYYLYHLATTPIAAEETQASAQVAVEQDAAPAETEAPEVSQSLADALAQAEAEARETEAAAQAALEAAESGTLVPEAEPAEETPAGETPAEPAGEAAAEPEPAQEAAPEPVQETAAPEESAPTLVPPVPGETVAAFSDSQLTYNAALEDWRTHNGVDLAAQLGDPVYAARAGEVLEIRSDLFLGTTVTLNHGDGLITVYGNLSEAVPVTSGERVEAGQVIGTVGNTAAGESHEAAWLHFAVEQDGVLVDPMDYLEE